MSDLEKILTNLDACRSAVEWVGDKPLAEAWTTCERGDWMLWIAAKLDVDRKLIVLAACDCAEPALKYATSDAGGITIETARAWCRDDATIEQVRAAAYAADAADAAAAAYAADAADAAAAYAAAAYAADAAAAYAADAAAAAAADDGYAAAYAREKSFRQSADLVRQRISLEMIVDKLQEKP